MSDMQMSAAERQKRLDGFETWLMEFDRFLEEWTATLPAQTARKLDFGPGSLAALGAWCIARGPDVEAVRSDKDGWNAASIYFGETVRKASGGRWMLNLGDPSEAFFGLPVLMRDGNPAPICPLTQITASVERRDPRMLHDLLGRWLKKARAA